MNVAAEWIDERVMIPELLRAAPQVRPVLDRYGLRGCGGALGPVESLAFFAKAHDVPIRTLLVELKDAVQNQATAPVTCSCCDSHYADTIYRPFFKAGIAVALTLGAVWGAYLLLRIGLSQSFAAVGLHEVNAHGHAQIFGWVGLFVMGFAYQAFPRFKHTTLRHPNLARASLWLMVTGLVLRSIGEPLATWLPWLGGVAVCASLVEGLAISLFAWIIVATLRRSGKELAAYDYYILSALAWFVIQAGYESAYLAATLIASEPEQVLQLVATWQGALREIQIHGFALLMILGVSQRIFHYFYGLPAPSQRISVASLICLNTAVLGEVAGLVLMQTSSHAWAALWYASVLLLAGATLLLVGNWRLFATPQESDRSLKFLRAAYAWLFVSLGMLVLLPVYQFALLPWLVPQGSATQIGFSHAYYGAIRHAITVGFISLMIVGVAAKIVPTLNGVDVRALAPLWLPFVLINTGCALRVSAQTLTDFTANAFSVAAVSGVLEVSGLAIWGSHLWLVMAGRARTRSPQAEPAHAPLSPGSPVVLTNRVGDVLDCYPELLDVFVSFGFKPLTNRLLRRTVARFVTIDQACRRIDVNPLPLVEALNAARQRRAAGRQPLSVLSAD